MILLDTMLERRERSGRPVRVGLVGAGFMGRGIARQILTRVRGLRLVAVVNRHIEAARRAYAEAGFPDARTVDSPDALDAAAERGEYVVADDPRILCDATAPEVVIEATGAVEYGARVVLRAIERGKHVVLMNAELDGTIGPVLKVKADRAGVVYTNADGDQPGVILNLYRFVRGIGVEPVLCGNIKGLHDPYRNPSTQADFARRWGQKPHMVTSFADGTKISFEQAIVANATGMGVARRGMYGPAVPAGTPIDEAVKRFPQEELRQAGGVVDYVVGAAPSPGVFVLGRHEDAVQRQYLNLYKLGPGPLYCFYVPYHLCHFEVPNTVARAALFGDAAITPSGAPRVEVVATAKVDLEAGQVLDGIGHYTTYGQCENAAAAQTERLLPMGLAEGCRLRRAVPRDRVLTLQDVDVPPGRLCDTLRAEQDALFATTPAPAGGGA